MKQPSKTCPRCHLPAHAQTSECRRCGFVYLEPTPLSNKVVLSMVLFLCALGLALLLFLVGVRPLGG